MTEATLDDLWKPFAWSCNVLLGGVTPDTDWNDKPIRGGQQYVAGGFRAALIQLRGDWEFYANALKFENWATNEAMCWLCRASNIIQAMHWTNFAADAAWRDTRW